MSMIDRAFVFSVSHLLLLVYISDYLQDILHSCVLDKTNANTIVSPGGENVVQGAECAKSD